MKFYFENKKVEVEWRYRRIDDSFGSIGLIQTADLLDIPRAIIGDEDTTELIRQYASPDTGNILIPRQSQDETQAAFRSWVTALSQAA